MKTYHKIFRSLHIGRENFPIRNRRRIIMFDVKWEWNEMNHGNDEWLRKEDWWICISVPINRRCFDVDGAFEGIKRYQTGWSTFKNLLPYQYCYREWKKKKKMKKKTRQWGRVIYGAWRCPPALDSVNVNMLLSISFFFNKVGSYWIGLSF